MTNLEVGKARPLAKASDFDIRHSLFDVRHSPLSGAKAKKPRRFRRWLKRIAVGLGAFAALSAGVFIFCWYAFPFPLEKLDRWGHSVRVEDRTGAPLLELVGADDQWRYPVRLADISPWLVQATLAVEDRRFRRHSGVDVPAALRAAWQNATNLRVVSGASTLTMQVCRMMDDRPRTPWAKAVESFRALQLETLRSKDQILEMYLNVAPYGRNIRGAEAAALVYFGKHARDLSLGEAALLAGLPQSPTRHRPDRDANAARARRELVLRRMAEEGIIGEELRREASEEPIVLAAPRERRATHAAFFALEQRPTGGRTTLDPALQAELEGLIRRRAPAWPAGTDAAAVVLDIATGEVRALVGSLDPNDPRDGQVNGATAWRSPGSALKPFVFACAMEDRRLAPDSIVYDIPIQRAGWAPENFDQRFHGELAAAEALRRSLNVPAILVAEQMGIDRCEGVMSAAGLALRQNPRRGAGLAAVTGAVEVRLIDLVNAYATLGRGGVRMPARILADDGAAAGARATRPPLSARAMDPAVCAALDDILSSRHRRPRGMEGLAPEEVPLFMWKTGTSSGRRDAWAVGHNGRFAAGVWVGRFSGAGDRGFVGAQAAEPLLADLFALARLRNDGAAAADAPPEGGIRPPPGSRPAPTWAVTNPLPRPAELNEPPRILSPSPGATFLAVGGAALIHPRANRPAQGSSVPPNETRTGETPVVPGRTPAAPGGLTWFLNGRLVPADAASRLALAPGAYELRCADDRGRSSAVRFAVR